MHGFGFYQFANGHRYEGAWHEGRRQGLGMYTYRNGETQADHWKNGVLDVPSTQNATYPVSPVAVNHSKVLDAVQEARIVAEKAYDVAKVDERVSRAVIVANRATTHLCETLRRQLIYHCKFLRLEQDDALMAPFPYAGSSSCSIASCLAFKNVASLNSCTEMISKFLVIVY